MISFARLGLLALLSLSSVSWGANPAAASDPVMAGVRLAVNRYMEAGYLNVRAAPNPNSEVIARLQVGAIVTTTGASSIYGDTLWIEVSAASTAGWINSRYVHRPGDPANAQPANSAGQIDRKQNHFFEGQGYIVRAMNSFEECERACLADNRCTAIEFYRKVKHCSLYDRVPDFGTADDADIGFKRPVVTGSIARAEPPATASSRPAEIASWNSAFVARAQLISIADGFLSRSGVTAYKIVPPDGKSNDPHLRWIYEDGSVGELLALRPGSALNLPEIANLSLEGQAKACVGEFAGARLRSRFYKGSEVMRVEARCVAGRQSTTASYSIIELPSGGKLRFGLFAPSDGAPTKDAEERSQSVENAAMNYMGANPGALR